ncbi:MAG: hypothetical protein ACLFV7_13185 [Phycisphaerae bacterium]
MQSPETIVNTLLTAAGPQAFAYEEGRSVPESLEGDRREIPVGPDANTANL